ncbi:hypothetical protein Sjap_009533 [Stephania japonica]|uniref:Uncharacterized protein n=1 Tax=Stephania japonica TaxID=461633 RepID=A0AAP0PDE3_9MAGN
MESMMEARLQITGLFDEEDEELVLKTGENNDSSSRVQLCLVGRLHNKKSVGQQLGNFIGRFLKYDPQNNAGGKKNFMRICVDVDARLFEPGGDNLPREWEPWLKALVRGIDRSGERWPLQGVEDERCANFEIQN